MLKFVLAALLIAAAPLALAANPTATLTVQVVPTSSTISPPAAAAAAGFTTLLANFDWSNNSLCATTTGASSQSCVAASPASNWLDCAGADTTKFLHYSSVGGLPCSQIGVGTDPITGQQSLYFQVVPSNPVNGVNLVLLSAIDSGNPNNTGYTTWPQGAYVESEYRLDSVDSFNSGPNTDGPFLWQNNTPCVLDFQIGELYAANGGAANSDIKYWCPETGLGYFWVTYNAGFPIAGYSPTQTHIYGGLRTTNGSNSIVSCVYIDNTFIVQSGQNTCTQQYPPSAPTIHGARSLVEMGVANNGTSAITQTLWIHWLRVWTCANGASGECNGTTLTGALNNGAVAYWH